jgi:hypothetical protein
MCACEGVSHPALQKAGQVTAGGCVVKWNRVLFMT